LYNPAIKVGVSAKFRRPWVGPWRITEKRSQLNYVITDQREKRRVVHVNRLKRAYAPVNWQELKREKAPRELRPKRRQLEEKVEEEFISPGPIPIRAPQVKNERQSPVRQRQVLDTPQSRREMGVTRESPPLPIIDLCTRLSEVKHGRRINNE
jgi:hypothetical protein